MKFLLPLLALGILAACTPVSDTTNTEAPAGKRAAMEWSGEVTTTSDDGVPQTTLKLTTSTGEELFHTDCTGLFSESVEEIEPVNGMNAVTVATCWWAGGGDEYGVFVGEAEQMTIMHRTVDEEAGFGTWEVVKDSMHTHDEELSLEWTSEQTGTGSSGEPLTTIKLVNTTLGMELFKTTCTGTLSNTEIDGTITATRCWWAGGGNDYAVVEHDGQFMVQQRTVDEEAGLGEWKTSMTIQ